MRRVCVVGSICWLLGACSIGGEDWTIGIGKYTLVGPSDAASAQSAAQPACDTLDGAMCSRDGKLLCAGNLEGVNAPAMCPSTGE